MNGSDTSRGGLLGKGVHILLRGHLALDVRVADDMLERSLSN